MALKSSMFLAPIDALHILHTTRRFVRESAPPSATDCTCPASNDCWVTSLAQHPQRPTPSRSPNSLFHNENLTAVLKLRRFCFRCFFNFGSTCMLMHVFSWRRSSRFPAKSTPQQLHVITRRFVMVSYIDQGSYIRISLIF